MMTNALRCRYKLLAAFVCIGLIKIDYSGFSAYGFTIDLQQRRPTHRQRINHAGSGSISLLTLSSDDKCNYDRVKVPRRRRGRGRGRNYYDDDDDTDDGEQQQRTARINTSEDEFYEDEDFDDDEDTDWLDEVDEIRMEQDLSDLFENVIIPNPLLDSIDPDGASERFPELARDPRFWFDMALFVCFLNFLSYVGPRNQSIDFLW
jgi:hypothetical protein